MQNNVSPLAPGERLRRIYELYATWAEDFDFACSEGCSTCCTKSVSMTSLEGEAVVEYIRTKKPHLLSLLETLPETQSNPNMTTNRFAAACLQGEDIEEEQHWDFAPCRFLRDTRCSIYPVRPFMCRSFGSRIRCDLTGAADIEPLFLTLNTVVMQCIEHLDRGRPWGNMEMILRRLVTGEKNAHLRMAERIPGWLIPPEEEDQVRPRLRALLEILNGS